MLSDKIITHLILMSGQNKIMSWNIAFINVTFILTSRNLTERSRIVSNRICSTEIMSCLHAAVTPEFIKRREVANRFFVYFYRYIISK
jgi:hypothetical protein